MRMDMIAGDDVGSRDADRLPVARALFQQSTSDPCPKGMSLRAMVEP
jgi:hypothetical protein